MPNVERALIELRQGKPVILVDDEDRENEGDLVLPAESVTADSINFLIKNARGLVCLSLEGKRIDELRLPMMSSRNQTSRQTAFTVSIEAKVGVETGISAKDRAHTIRTAVDASKGPDDIITPGHVFPLRALDGGVLVRAGHTEGSIDLMKKAGLKPAAVICEIIKDDGTMARLPDLAEFSKAHGNIPIVTIQEIIADRMKKETLIEKIAETDFPTEFGMFRLHAYRSLLDQTEHVALKFGETKDPTLVRVHSECLTGDALGSLRCDCGPQLRSALHQIAQNGNGILVYMRRHEGRGIGLGNKIRAYELQDQGLDTVEANRHLGFKADLRHYGLGAQILKSMGVNRLNLLTNNPRKIVGLDGYGLEIIDRVPIRIEPNPFNSRYLETKKTRLGHDLIT